VWFEAEETTHVVGMNVVFQQVVIMPVTDFSCYLAQRCGSCVGAEMRMTAPGAEAKIVMELISPSEA
jgi:hypothetical protein